MIDSKATAATLSALGHPSRVDILKCLLAHYPSGLTAGDLSSKTAIAPSTLSHHLREMAKGGIVSCDPAGQRTITTLNLDHLSKLAGALMQICCSVEQTTQNESSI